LSRSHCFAVSHWSPQYMLTFQLTASHTFHTTAPTATVMSPPVSHVMQVTSCHSAVSVYLKHSQSDILRPTLCQLFYLVHDLFGKTQHCDIHVCCISMAGPLYPDKSTNCSVPCDAAYLSHLLHQGQGMNLHLFWASNFRFWTNFLFKAYFIDSFTRLIQHSSGPVYLHSYMLTHLCRPWGVHTSYL
jgi:hypothetical protein